MPIREDLIWEGRTLHVEWLGAPFMPPLESVTQAGGVCFTSGGQIVLVAGQSGQWALPGGHVEPGETLEQTLKREVSEEACASVRRCAYLGAQQVSDPGNPDRPGVYYQIRFWARVTLRRFRPRFERTRRMLVAPSELVPILSWRTPHIAQAILDAALTEERRFSARSR
ncbi:MAG TPA: NUDIX hydrolase [Anaerolineae bacterium]